MWNQMAHEDSIILFLPFSFSLAQWSQHEHGGQEKDGPSNGVLMILLHYLMILRALGWMKSRIL